MKNKELPCSTCGQDLQLPADINAEKLAALREAGEKMAKQLRILSKSSYFTREDAAAIDAWESANK